jgi:hypothetical protein
MIKKLIYITIIILLFATASLSAPATMYVTPAGAGGQTGADWANAFSIGDFETDAEGSAEAGDLYYFKGGVTYTLTSDIVSSLDGTAALPIRIVGVIGESTTPATGSDRPTIAASGNSFQFDDYWTMENLIGTTTDSVGFQLDVAGLFKNLSVVNSSETADRPAIYNNGYGARVINCDISSTNGYAARLYSHAKVLYTYAHDSNVCFYAYSDDNIISWSIADTCTTAGIDLNGQNYQMVMNSTIYNSGTGILGGASVEATIINNIIDSCTTGISMTSETLDNYYDYNNYYNNTSDTSNVTKGGNATANDPNFTDASGGNFSIASGSCLDAAQVITLGVD